MQRRSSKYPFEKHYPLNVWTRIDQAGGKYGTFPCPVCREGRVDYKFTAGFGQCQTCRTGFVDVEDGPRLRIAGDSEKVPHWLWLQVDYDYSDDDKLIEILIRRLNRESK